MQGWNSFHLCADITPTTNLELAILAGGCELELALFGPKVFFFAPRHEQKKILINESFRSKDNSQLCCVEAIGGGTEEERGWDVSIDHKTKTKNDDKRQ